MVNKDKHVILNGSQLHKPIAQSAKKLQIQKIDLLASKVVALKQQSIYKPNISKAIAPKVTSNIHVAKTPNKSLFYNPKPTQQQLQIKKVLVNNWPFLILPNFKEKIKIF